MSSVNDPQLVISIVPRLPPVVDGVGDYAFNLACQLRLDYNINTHFLIGDPAWSGNNQLEGFQTTKLASRSAEALFKQLAKTLPNSPILLHYVGYGYANRGCPTWLIQALHQWKKNVLGTSLITMFHEIYAAGCPPWTSAFWLFPLQKRLATKLAHLSDSVLTSKLLYANILQSLSSQHQSVDALPVFSTIGEPDNPPLLTTRQKQLVIFGSANNRNQVYKSESLPLGQLCQSLQIDTVIDIGPKLSKMPKMLKGIPITVMGQLPATKVSQILLQSFAGLLNYNPDYLAKSTIFAAYCSHGLMPINVQGSEELIDGLVPGTHYLTASQLDCQLNLEKMQEIATSAYQWYKNHTLAVHARAFASQINRNS